MNFLTVYLHAAFRPLTLSNLNKADLRSQIISRLRTDLELQTAAAQLARDEAISEESRPENKYDTHSQEAAYLAEGQARLAADILASIGVYESMALSDFDAATPIGLGALVELSSRGAGIWYFLGPRAGGLELTLDGQSILVITPSSPFGRVLLGRKVGDAVVPPGRGTMAAQRILTVR